MLIITNIVILWYSSCNKWSDENIERKFDAICISYLSSETYWYHGVNKRFPLKRQLMLQDSLTKQHKHLTYDTRVGARIAFTSSKLLSVWTVHFVFTEIRIFSAFHLACWSGTSWPSLWLPPCGQLPEPLSSICWSSGTSGCPWHHH